MNRVEILSEMDRRLLRTFSTECLVRLRKHLLFEFVLPLIGDFMKANVEKEIAKDRMIIKRAGENVARGKESGEEDIVAALEGMKKIDAEYLQKAHLSRISFSLHYEGIEEIRRKRVSLIFDTVTVLLLKWETGRTFEEAVRDVYTREQFGQSVFTFLHLYGLETRKLGESIRIILPARIAKEVLVEKLYETMEMVSNELMETCLQKVFAG